MWLYLPHNPHLGSTSQWLDSPPHELSCPFANQPSSLRPCPCVRWSGSLGQLHTSALELLQFVNVPLANVKDRPEQAEEEEQVSLPACRSWSLCECVCWGVHAQYQCLSGRVHSVTGQLCIRLSGKY